jgi:hypothetical protein
MVDFSPGISCNATSELCAEFPCHLEEAYHECIMAGFTPDEANEHVKMKQDAVKDILNRESDETISESFWDQVGFPKGTRWWEYDQTTDDKSAYVGQPHTNSHPTTKKHVLQPKGFNVRSWKGPLPRKKPAQITLEAFLPDRLQAISA